MVAETVQHPTHLEDPLSYLPCSAIFPFRKGQVIYEPGRQTPHLYLVMEGCVKINRSIENTEIVLNLCQADDFFGEAAFLGVESEERAVGLEAGKLMSWPVETVQELILRHPQLGIAFVQLLARRSVDLGERVGTLSMNYTSRRLAKTILQLADRMGQPDQESPNVRHLAPFPHKLLAQYIGTTREAATHCMNRFRRQGFVAYSRRGMVITCDAIREWLETETKPSTARTPEREGASVGDAVSA